MSQKIRQETLIKAKTKIVFEALTDSKKFSQMSGGAPTEINPVAGGAFSCFGGMVTGRFLELDSDKRIVQAWRAGTWEPGDYSIVRFDLKTQGNDTLLVLTHAGFPEGEQAHLSSGWQTHYFEPLKKFLEN